MVGARLVLARILQCKIIIIACGDSGRYLASLYKLPSIKILLPLLLKRSLKKRRPCSSKVVRLCAPLHQDAFDSRAKASRPARIIRVNVQAADRPLRVVRRSAQALLRMIQNFFLLPFFSLKSLLFYAIHFAIGDAKAKAL